MSATRQSPAEPEIDKLIVEVRRIVDKLAARKTGDLRAVRRTLTRRLVKASADTVLRLAYDLLDQPWLPERFVAYELVNHHPAALARIGAVELERLGHGMADWGTVDAFSCYIAGPVWREGQVRTAVIRRWAASDDRWLRRAALVSTVALNSRSRGGDGDAARTLSICRLLIHDRDDMVVKAMSWALRELVKRDAKSAARFLKDHQTLLAPRVLREVGNKLRTGLKNPRKLQRARH